MGIIISLTGFDGLGKSTQVNLLSNYLKKQKKKVLVTEMMFSYFLLKPMIKVLRFSTGSLPGGPVKVNRSFLLKLWFIPAFIDIWLMYIFKILPLKKKYDFVIADRCYCDIWANLLYYGYVFEFAYTLLVKFLPKADLAFILLAKPEVVLKREMEFPVSYYREQALIYQSLSKMLDFKEIDASLKPEKVFDQISSTLKQIVR